MRGGGFVGRPPVRAKGRGSDDNAWLETWADAITLLMAFFVVLLSLSKTDEAKYERVAAAISAEISHEPIPVPKEAAPAKGQDEGGGESVHDKLSSSLTPLSRHENIRVETTSESILIEFSGTLLYDRGSAVLRRAALPLIDQVSATLVESEEREYEVIVEGHTDNVPIRTGIWPSNWELSSSRATAVVRRMIDKGIPISAVSASAFADTRPLAPNQDEAGQPIVANQARNRRVLIRINR